MTDQLTPPPLRDLPPHRALEMRDSLLELTSTEQVRSTRSGWAVAAIAAAVALVVLAVGIQVIKPLGTAAPGPAASPSPIPSSPAVPPTGVVQDDLGLLPSTRAQALMAACMDQFAFSGPNKMAVQLDLAVQSRVLGPVVWLSTPDRVHVCASRDESYDDYGAAVPRPNSENLVRTVVSNSSVAGSSRSSNADVSATLAVTAADDISYVLLRVKANGQVSAWSRADVHDGFAVVGASLEVIDAGDDVGSSTEARAFTRDGREVPVSP